MNIMTKKRTKKQNLREKIAQNQLSAASVNADAPKSTDVANTSVGSNPKVSKEHAREKKIRKSPQIHGLTDDDTECTDTCSPSSSASRYSDTSSRYRSYSSSSSGYNADEDDDDSDDSHEWCIHCKSLIQMPVYEKNAHFHSGRFDMWLCRKCFPVDTADNKTCKCVMHCTACARDVLYNDGCIPFYNTSRGFCDTCSDNIKKVARGSESSLAPAK